MNMLGDTVNMTVCTTLYTVYTGLNDIYTSRDCDCHDHVQRGHCIETLRTVDDADHKVNLSGI